MARYQLYLLGDDDRDVARQDHSCADDRIAIQIARSLSLDHKIDVWHEARRVARIEKGDFALRIRPVEVRSSDSVGALGPRPREI